MKVEAFSFLFSPSSSSQEKEHKEIPAAGGEREREEPILSHQTRKRENRKMAERLVRLIPSLRLLESSPDKSLLKKHHLGEDSRRRRVQP